MTEAKYMALGQAMKELIWLKRLLEEVGFHKQTEPIQIHSNNQGALALTKNPTFYARTKHIDIHHHFLRERYEVNEKKIPYCDKNEMLADILAKPLSRDKHEKFSEGMGLKYIKR